MEAATDKGTQTLLDKRLLKVLLVEDEATDRIPVERILRTCSSPAEFVVESAVNLSEAIKNLTEKQYDVVLLDLELPDSSGIEILQQVIKVAPDIPVVVLTEQDDEQTGFSALEDGATDYLVKDLPLDVVLVRTIVYAMQRKKIQMQSLKLTHDNNERMKELDCLYGISKLVEDPGISLEEMFEKTVCLIPAGWQYPGIVCARIIFEGKAYKTDNFKPSKWTQSADITLQGQKVGTVEVSYMEERPQSDEGPFLMEKCDLIDAIGERLGKMAERFKGDEALREKSALLVKVINSVPDFIFAKDTKLRTIICNEAYASAVGKKPEEMTGHTDIENGWAPELVCGNPAKGIRGFENDDRDALSGKTIHNPCDPANTPNGVLIFDTYKMPLCGKDGEIIGMLGIARDITERKKAEEDLAILNQKNEFILRAAAEGILGLDLHGNHIFVNPAAAKMLGYEVEELIGRPSHSTWHHTKPDGSPYPKEECHIYASYLDGAVHRSSIEVFWRKDGTSFPVEYASTPIYEQSRLVGTVVTFADITERKKAEEQIRLASEEWERTFNSITDLVFIQDKDFTIKKVNKTFAAALKMNPKDIVGKKCYDILHNLDHPWPGCPLKKAKQDGASHTEEVNDPHIGIPLLVTASPIIDANGEIIGAVHIARDITERKNKEKQIQAAKQAP